VTTHPPVGSDGPPAPGAFDPAALSGQDEPVRRYFAHALGQGASLAPGVRLRMRGRVKVGAWLPFAGEWRGDGRGFTWRAAAGPAGMRLLRVLDRYADGAGGMDVRLGPVPLVRAHGVDVTRSAAGRAAVEAIWAPAGILPHRGVSWHAVSDRLIAGTWSVGPERPEVRIEIDHRGGVRSASVLRWRDARSRYLPCGAVVVSERSFGPLRIPSRITAGWGFGTPEASAFFEAEVLAAVQEPASP
jgi:hypothetical protein